MISRGVKFSATWTLVLLFVLFNVAGSGEVFYPISDQRHSHHHQPQSDEDTFLCCSSNTPGHLCVHSTAQADSVEMPVLLSDDGSLSQAVEKSLDIVLVSVGIGNSRAPPTASIQFL
jgi:hypothetical protein